MSKWLTVIALALPLLVAATRNWKNGTLLSVDEHKELTSSRTRAVIENRVWSYSIDAGEVIYEAERGSKRPIQIEINGPVSFALDGSSLYVKDASGHEFKLSLLKTTRKKPPDQK